MIRRQTTLRHWIHWRTFTCYGDLLQEMQDEVQARFCLSAILLWSMTCREAWRTRRWPNSDRVRGHQLWRWLVEEGHVPLLRMHRRSESLVFDGTIERAMGLKQWAVAQWCLEQEPTDDFRLIKEAVYRRCPRRAIFNLLCPADCDAWLLAYLVRQLDKPKNRAYVPVFARLYDWDFAANGLLGLRPGGTHMICFDEDAD